MARKKTFYVVNYVADIIKGLTESLTFKSKKEMKSFIDTRKPSHFTVDTWVDNQIRNASQKEKR